MPNHCRAMLLRCCVWVCLLCVVTPLQARTAVARISHMQVTSTPAYWYATLHANKPIRASYYFVDRHRSFVLDLKNVSLKPKLFQGDFGQRHVYEIHLKQLSAHHWQLRFTLRNKIHVGVRRIPATRTQGYRLELRFPKHHVDMYSVPKASHAKEKGTVIVIDPGHGGKDPGAAGRHHREKNIVFAIAKKLQADINAHKGFRAVLTRRGDYYVFLRQRLAIARDMRAKLFLSLHADAYKDKTAEGASVFALSKRGATTEAARWLATRENLSESMDGVSLQNKNWRLKSLLINLSQDATITASLKIGEEILGSMHSVTPLHHGRRVEQAAFVVLKSPDIPSLLIETGFISNPAQERRLSDPKNQARLAKAIAEGVFHYYQGRGSPAVIR